MTSDGKTSNIKVVDLKKLWNFVVENFSIGIRLEPQIINLCLVYDSMWGTNLYYKHKWVIDGVVEEGSREGEVSGPNPTDRVARDFTRKNARANSQWAFSV